MVVLLAATLVGALAFGETYTDGDLVWTYSFVDDGKATLSGVERKDGEALSGALTMPSKVANATVVEVAEDSFQELQITALALPGKLETINAGAFANCTALEALTIPDSVTKIDGCHGYGGGLGAFAN